MSRTERQRQADEALTKAIEHVQDVYFEDLDGILTDYLVVAQRQGWDDKGDPVETVCLISRDDFLPTSRQLGLIEYASLRLKSAIANDYAEDA